MFLNTYNYKNVTDGWIKLNSLHEAYPGHHVQYVRAAVDETPETVKIGAKLVPLLRGPAFGQSVRLNSCLGKIHSSLCLSPTGATTHLCGFVRI